MAIIKENQPVLFTTSSAINCSSDIDDYVQIVDNTDITQFQLGLTICNGSEQVLNSPQFADPADYLLGAGWDISYPVDGALLCATGSIKTNVENTTTLDPNKYYALTITVDSVTSGVFEVYLGGTYLGSFSEAGTYTWFGFPTINIGGRYTATISPTNATDECCVSSIEAYEYLTNFIFAIYDENDTYIDEINYNDNPEYYTFVKDSLTVSINWGELGISNGCYYICMLDPCDNTGGQNYPADITNGTFTGSATGWTLGSAWSYSANTVVATSSGTPANNYLTQSSVFTNYTSTYSITVDVTAISGSLRIYFGDNLVSTITTTGQHVVTGVPSVDKDLHLYINSGTCTVTSVTANEVTSDNYTCNAESNMFNVNDYLDSCPETLLINACNDEDGMGFVFDGSGFTPRIRLQGKLKQSKYNAERVLEEDSDGRKRIVFYSRRKSKNLVADLLPEYVHDFLSTLIGYDKFYINGVAYIVDDDEYNVTYDESQDNVGSVSMQISEQTQLIKNINCTSNENSCNIEGNYLLQADDNEQYITLVNGELIEING